MADNYYRFSAGVGWLTHLWKSATRQDHAHLRPVPRPLLPEDGVAIDVGAHGGQITRLLAGAMPRGQVFAVEPSGYARSVLRPSLWLRGARNVVVVAAALGSEPGVALLRTPVKRRGDMGYGLATLGPAPAEGGIAEPVAVTTLDALVSALNLTRLDFVKADVEGYEAAMIAGAGATLRRFRPALLLEHDPARLVRAGASNEALWGVLLAQGYWPHAARGAKPVPLDGGPRDGDILWLARL